MAQKHMSWKDLTDSERQRARDRLTRRQLDVYTLHLAGCSQRQIATMLGLTKTTVADHKRRALELLAQEDAA